MQQLPRCLRSGIEIKPTDEVTVLRCGAREFAVLTRMMPTADDTTYDYSSTMSSTTAAVVTPIALQPRVFAVCIGDGSVPIRLVAGSTASCARVTSFWYEKAQFQCINFSSFSSAVVA